jgi:hypothetical protein
MFCVFCQKEYTFDQLSDQTVDGVGDFNCPQCGAVLTADKTIVDKPEPPAKGTWTVNPSGPLQKPVTVKIANLARFIGE